MSVGRAVPGHDRATCPTCAKPARRGAAAADPVRGVDPFPFCSFRCQAVDLGRWLDEDYRIPDAFDQSGGGIDGGPASDDDPQ